LPDLFFPSISGSEVFFKDEAKDGFVFQVGFQKADALVGKAVDHQGFGFCQNYRRDHQQVFLAVNAKIGGFFDRFAHGIPAFFLDGAGRVFNVHGAGVLLNKVAALDFFVKNFNIGLQVIRTIITHGDHGFVFFQARVCAYFRFISFSEPKSALPQTFCICRRFFSGKI